MSAAIATMLQRMAAGRTNALVFINNFQNEVAETTEHLGAIGGGVWEKVGILAYTDEPRQGLS
jgi:hypothetical protein